MNDRIPMLEIQPDEAGGFLLTQDDLCGNAQCVALHAVQVRHLAVLAGLLPAAPSAPEYTPPAWVLARRLRVLVDRIDQLDDWLRVISEAGREDLEHEISFSFATLELAQEFCADLPPKGARQDGAGHDVTATSPERYGDVTPAATPSHGGARESERRQLDLVDRAGSAAHEHRAA